MSRFRILIALGLCGPVFAVAGCSMGSAPPPPPTVARPSAFIPLGLGASYLASGAIGGQAARAAKMRAAKIRPLTPAAASDYVARAERDLRSQTVGIGVDVIRVGNGLLDSDPSDPDLRQRQLHHQAAIRRHAERSGAHAQNL